MPRKVDKLRHERADRESRVVIDAERKAREATTARLRADRLGQRSVQPANVDQTKSR